MHTQILRLPAVLERTGIGRSTLYAKLAANEFPPGVKLGARAIGWDASEIQKWLDDRKAASRDPQGAQQ